MAVKIKIKKGQMVYKKLCSGDHIGKVDEQYMYTIKSIGPRQATLVQVDKVTGAILYGGRGHNIYIQTEEEAKRMNDGSSNNIWRHFYPWDWSQVLVPLGEAGWDAECNF